MTRPDSKRAFWENVLIWAGAVVSVLALLNCVSGGSLWVTLSLLPLGLGFTFGGVQLIANRAKENSPKPPEPAQT